MRVGAVICFVIAALGTVAALKNVVGAANRPEGAANFVGYAVGSFLVPSVLLIVGLILWGKSSRKNDRES